MVTTKRYVITSRVRRLGSSPVSQLEDSRNSTGTGYSSNASDTLSVTTGMGFMAMFLWTLLSLL